MQTPPHCGPAHRATRACRPHTDVLCPHAVSAAVDKTNRADHAHLNRVVREQLASFSSALQLEDERHRHE
eukprot:4696323-Prymnesium_polylepis.1